METTPIVAISGRTWHEALSYPNIPIFLIYEENNRFSKLHYRLIKRAVDVILGSALTLLFLSWMIPVLAFLIRMDSPGPVFFRQKRTGIRNGSFYCLKFRSMYVNKDADRLAVEKDDKRITRLGHFIRRCHIDELPQLLNVIMGDMSLVGPRPHMLRHTVIYSQLVENYNERHRVKPGIAGLAQLRGYHGTINSLEDLRKRCASDFEYIEKWSPFDDIIIFFATLFKEIKTMITR